MYHDIRYTGPTVLIKGLCYIQHNDNETFVLLILIALLDPSGTNVILAKILQSISLPWKIVCANKLICHSVLKLGHWLHQWGEHNVTPVIRFLSTFKQLPQSISAFTYCTEHPTLMALNKGADPNPASPSVTPTRYLALTQSPHGQLFVNVQRPRDVAMASHFIWSSSVQLLLRRFWK